MTANTLRRAWARGAFVGIAALVATARLGAHDFWIEPTSYVPDVGRIIGIRARVGDGFLGDPVPRDSALVDQLIVEDASGRRPLVGHDGDDPAGFLRINVPGLHVIGYLGKPSRVELAADKFNAYLLQEGLEYVAAARAARNQSGAGARDMFTRCAKALVLSGVAAPDQHDRVLGCPFEIVAERNPYAMAPGQTLPLRLVYEGKPLAGALVVAMNRRRPTERITARSDEKGRVQLTLPSGGGWLIKAVHMVPAPANANADWASFWASVTFDLPTPPATAPAAGRS